MGRDEGLKNSSGANDHLNCAIKPSETGGAQTHPSGSREIT